MKNQRNAASGQNYRYHRVMQSGLGSALNQGKVEARYYSFAGDYANRTE
ncbi:MAG: hypothetical protein ACLUSP_07860 [Christensenellales bacterium]